MDDCIFSDSRAASKYIFLDIDGVLNNPRTKAAAPYDLTGIQKDKLLILKEIVEKTGGKIVLISDWRMSFLPGDHMPKMAEYLEKKMSEAGLTMELVSTEYRYSDRAKEIRSWLKEHPCDGFVILDDFEPFLASRILHPL